MPVVNVIGDSHTQYFVIKKRSTADRMRLDDPSPFGVRAEVVHGASLTGLRAYASTTRVRERIEKLSSLSEYLCISLGQVDLELGFYFRQVIKGESWTPESYVDFLLGIYDSFLSGVDHLGPKLALKGVNLTVLSTRGFTASYLSRILTENDAGRHADARAHLFDIILTERQQNDLHLAYNQAVKGLCTSRGLTYFDLNDFLAARDAAGAPLEPRVLDGRLQPMKMDHHIVPTVEVFRQHYFALGRAFDLVGEDMRAL